MTSRPAPAVALRVADAIYRFRESLFALPALLVFGGMILAEGAAVLDRLVGEGIALPLTVSMNSNGATWLLSTVAGATITTAGVVFSLTIVSLQLASSQFSPRVMRSFIRDRVSQTVIGLLVATFVYCVLTLRHLSAEGSDLAPRVSMTAAIVLTVGTVVLIIAYLNRLAHGLQVGEVVRTISAEAHQVIDAMTKTTQREEPADPDSTGPARPGLSVYAIRDGWVTQAPSPQLFSAVAPQSVIRLETRTGAYIHRGEVLLTVTPTPPEVGAVAVARKLAAAVDIADVRTMQQDVDFAVRQLVDVALRALSSAINDPTTATEVVLRLGSILRTLLVVDLPSASVRGPQGRMLIRPWELTHEEYIEHAFDQIRQSCTGQPHVVAALLRVLHMLIGHVRAEDRPHLVPALREQIRAMIDAMNECPHLDPYDLDRLRTLAEGAADPAEHDPPRRM